MLNLQSQLEQLGTLLALTVPLAVAACGGDATGPATGSIQVTTATTGGTIDSDGYTVTVDGGQGQAIDVNASMTFGNVAPGNHTVELTGVAANCGVSGENPRTVNVAGGATASTDFAVTCSLLTGSLEVTTSTTGETIDPDGYALSIDAGAGEPTGLNATLTLQDVPAGPRSVQLTGVAANCAVGGGNPRTVDVPAGGTARTTFPVSCIFALRDQIVFASDRDGDFELYVMNTDGTGLQNLTNNPAFDSRPAISPDGTKIAFETNRDGNHEIYVMNADGTRLVNLTNDAAFDEYPAWSPDGKKIVFDNDRDGSEIHVMNANGTNLVRLTDTGASNFAPAWSPDGSKIAFATSRDGCCNIYLMNADGTDQINLTKNAPVTLNLDPAWSPDGRKIAFDTKPRQGGNWEIYVMNADGTGQANLTNNGALDEYSAWCPDRKIVFDSNRDGDFEIYVMQASGTLPKKLTNDAATDYEAVCSP